MAVHKARGAIIRGRFKIIEKPVVEKERQPQVVATKTIVKKESVKRVPKKEKNWKIKPVESKEIKNMKFALNAHRAVIQNRDDAKVLKPKENLKVSDALMKSIMSETRISKNTKPQEAQINTNPTYANTALDAVKDGEQMVPFICEPDGNTYTSDTNGIIVTMTSWSKRINNVERTVKTILANSVMPEKIIINLSTEEFPNKEKDLPNGLQLLLRMNQIVEIHWLKHNTAVWKKIIPTIMRFRNASVVCIDDDRLYPKDFIATFKKAAEKYPHGPVTGANISFYRKFKQHCGHATLDKYLFYKDGLDFITKEVVGLKSSDSVLTVIANMTGHESTFLGKNYLSLIPQNNNPINGWSTQNGIKVSQVIKKAGEMFEAYLNPKIEVNTVQPKKELTVQTPIKPKSLNIEKPVKPSMFTPRDTNQVTKPMALKAPTAQKIKKEEIQKPIIANKKVALCAIAKLENNYVREWVEHYKDLGFSHIFLYDNNDIDGERFDTVIGDYIDSGFVTIIDVRGETAAQTASYTSCYNRLLDGYDWVAFFDLDEFLILKSPCKTISEFVSLPKFSNYNCIRVCWRQFTDSGLLDVNDGNYSVKRFKEIVPITKRSASAQTKPIMRTKIKRGLVINSPHGAMDEPLIKACSATGTPCKNDINTNVITWEGAAINHYRFKTIGEYVKNKIQKGWPTFYGGITNKFLNVDFFFAYNTRTKAKMEYAIKLKNTIANTKKKIYVSSWVKYDKIGIIKRNWGDELNFFFLPKILPYKLIPYRNDSVIDPAADKKAPNYLMIGSVINPKYVDNRTIIWGSGIVSGSKDLRTMAKPARVCAVRGPLTRNKLLSLGISCPEVYGDPALLLPYVYNPTVEKKHKIGLILHWRTTTRYPKLENDKDIKIIDMKKYDNWKDVINSILSCEYIVSESLHGLIVSEAYGVPNLWIDCQLNSKEDSDFKFNDFFLSIGKGVQKSYKITSSTTKDDLLTELAKYEHINTLDLNKLIDACPVDIIINRPNESDEEELAES